MEFFDSHAHYTDEAYNEDRESLIERMYKNDITKIIIAGSNLETSKQAIELANKYPHIYATCGIHPSDIKGIDIEEQLNEIKEISKNEKVVAIGEIGLDYHWDKDNKEEQVDAFIKQIELANEVGLPIVIHTRDAYIDTIDVLKHKINAERRGVFHCCPLNQELVREALELGYNISFSGVVTFKNAKNVDEVIKMVPLEKLQIETDAPYLSPEPFRGTRNNSENVKLTAQKIAEVKGISIEEIAKITYENTMRMFIK